MKSYSALIFCFCPRFWITNAFWFNSHLSPRVQFNFYSKYCLCCASFSELFAAVPIFVSLSEMFFSCGTAQFELLLEHSEALLTEGALLLPLALSRTGCI